MSKHPSFNEKNATFLLIMSIIIKYLCFEQIYHLGQNFYNFKALQDVEILKHSRFLKRTVSIKRTGSKTYKMILLSVLYNLKFQALNS